ncbi:MAG: glycosyltransferase [archaeon]
MLKGNKFDFSVVIPAKNAEKTIERCIICLLNQDYPKKKYEIILVDNNSVDNTVKKAGNFPVKIFFNVKKGAGPTRNLGVKKAKGKIIAFIDSDRFAEKNWLKEAKLFFERNKNLNIVAGKIVLDKYSIIKKSIFMAKMDQAFFVENGFAATCNMFIKKETFNKLGGFDERFFITNEDVEFGERANAFGEKIALLEKAVVRYNPRPLWKYLKNEFRRGQAISHLLFLKKNGLNYEFPKVHKTFNLVKTVMFDRKYGLFELLFFLIINGTGKLICVFGKLFEDCFLLMGYRKKELGFDVS